MKATEMNCELPGRCEYPNCCCLEREPEIEDEFVAATERLVRLEKPTKPTYKATEQYLDDEDLQAFAPLDAVVDELKRRDVSVLETLKALEDLRNHLRGKYYGG